MSSRLLGEYLVFFAKFEYSLIRAGFFKHGRKVNGDSSIKAVIADWDKFIDNLCPNFFTIIKNNTDVQEIFKDDGPQIWAQKGNECPQFYKDSTITCTHSLIYACKHIRNNLVHGEKLETDQKSVRRNQNLLEAAKTILKTAMEKANTIAYPHISSIYNDIDTAYTDN